jgi:hypothetical protein
MAYEATHRKRPSQQVRILGFARVDAELVAHHLVEVDFGMLRQSFDDHLRFLCAEAFELIVRHLLGELALRIGSISRFSMSMVACTTSRSAFRPRYSPTPIESAPANSARNPLIKTALPIALGDSDAGNDPQRREDAVLHSENDFANAAAFLEGPALQRVGNSRLDLLPARHVLDDVLDGRRQIPARCSTPS